MSINNIKALREYTGLDFRWNYFTGVQKFRLPFMPRVWGIRSSLDLTTKLFKTRE